MIEILFLDLETNKKKDLEIFKKIKFFLIKIFFEKKDLENFQK